MNDRIIGALAQKTGEIFGLKPWL